MNQEIVTKKCSNPNCSQPIKPITEFHKRNNRLCGYKSQCKLCCNLIKREWHYKNKISENNKSRQWHINNPERSKEIAEVFNNINPNYKKINKKNWDIKNKKYISKNNKIYYINNKEKLLNKSKKYQKIPINKKRRNERDKNRRINNIGFKLNLLNHSRTLSAIKNKQKSGHTMELVGCNGLEHKNYLEIRFYNSDIHGNMTWKNHGDGYGKWQIHHICPLEFVNWDDFVEQKQAIHYTNTTPLWYEDHCEEHRKINEQMLQYDL